MKKFSSLQLTAIGLKAAGVEHQDIAREIGRSVSTVNHWSVDPDFQQAVEAAKNELFYRSLAKLQVLMDKAIDTLAELHQDKDAAGNVRVRAAATLLEYGFRARDFDVARKLDAVENALQELGEAEPNIDADRAA